MAASTPGVRMTELWRGGRVPRRKTAVSSPTASSNRSGRRKAAFSFSTYTVDASAGRSSNIEGGVAIVAIDLSNGETKWSRCIGHDALRLNDMLSLRDGQIAVASPVLRTAIRKIN